jgi:hypothetical protein
MNTQTKIDTFAKLVKDGLNKWTKAGELLVSIIDDDPNCFKKIVKRHPFITNDLLSAFERIGRKQLHPMLLLSNSVASRRIASFPYAEQNRIMTDGVHVLRRHGGRDEFVRKSIDELTQSDVNLSLDDRRLKSPEEQKKALDALEKKWSDSNKRREVRYSINGQNITFFHDCTFSRGELESIIDEWPAESADEIKKAMSANQLKSK